MAGNGRAQRLEQQRRKAMALIAEQHSPENVAKDLGVSVRSVFRWRKAAMEWGDGALSAVPRPGRGSSLTREQTADLYQRLAADAMVEGCLPKEWTCARVKRLIEQQYGVSYHIAHISRLVRRLGFRFERSVEPVMCPTVESYEI